MKPEHRKNLETLRDYLRSGELKADFGMRTFNDQKEWRGPIDGGPAVCGSVGCAVGHATICIEPLTYREDWHDYSFRMFGTEVESEEWCWMFGADWAEVDNTPGGAADRIDWYLAKGVPVDWEDQMLGDAPPCYRQGA